MVPSPSGQSHRQALVRDHCVPVHSKVVDWLAFDLGVGPSSTVATHDPDEQSVPNLYQAV